MAAVTKETMIGDLLRIDAETKCAIFSLKKGKSRTPKRSS